ncbi:MAG TPA: beta-propeller domain-containing protein [Tepidisphaeraceae bacterium]|jgi:uncharacterized secreted protein with C-terminal beta-propeller domain
MSTIESLERRQLLAAVNWVLSGSSANDNIVVHYAPGSTTKLQAFINGKLASTRSVKGLSSLEVFGNEGNDRISVDLSASPRNFTVWASGGAGKDWIIGGAERDIFLGGSSRDTLIGGSGNDNLRGGTGSDNLLGDDGDDYIQGNAGHDTLAGGWGDDLLTGGDGNDQLRGGGDGDDLIGGRDADVIKGGDRKDTISGGAQRDVLYIQKEVDNVPDTTGDQIKADDVTEPLRRAQSEDELRDWIVNQTISQWQWSFGKPKQQPVYWAYDAGMVKRAPSAAQLVDASGAGAEDTSSSSTNTQVSGVDEADRVETDGKYIYLLRDQELVVIAATPAKDMKVISRTKIDGDPSGIYLSGSRLAIISDNISRPVWRGRLEGDIAGIPEYETPKVRVTVLDVANPAAPAKVQDTQYDGSLNDSRVIDGRLYLVIQNYLAAPEPQTVKNEKGEEIYESEASARQRLLAGEWKKLLPNYTGTSRDGSSTSGGLMAVPNVYLRDGDRMDVATVALVDLNSDVAKPVSTTSVAGADGTVYASRDSLYLAGSQWFDEDQQTEIVKFSLGIDQVTLQANGTVKGDVLNAFSMDENGRYFRIATTHDWGTNSASAVTVLDQVGDDLTPVGVLDGLAVGEQIYGARFMGDRAYLVTFRQIDPLFSLDMSDPTKPTVVGQLKIPGVSNYLYPIDESHLIGVGRSGDETGRLGPIQLSLFDVTDFGNPKQVDTYKFSDKSGYTSTPVLYDPHAFSYFAEYSTLALPVTDGRDKDHVEVFSVNAKSGFTLLGEVDHDGEAQRSLRIGSVIYIIGTDGVQSHALSDVSTLISKLGLPEEGIGRGIAIDLPMVIF